MGEIRVRPAEAGDLEAITSIYNHYVVTTPITFDLEPFTVEARRPWMSQFASSGRRQLLVATDAAGAVVGYACSHGFREKPAYDPSVETSVYVKAGSARRGIGTALYEELFARLRGEDVHRVYAGLTMPNDASLALHRRFGFEKCAHFTEVGRKFGRFWDVILLEKPL